MRTIINDGECIKRYMNVWGNLFASCCTAYPTLQHTPSPFHPFFPHLFVGFYYNRDTILQTISSENFVNQQHQGFQISSNRLNASNPQDRNIVRSFTHRSINDNESFSPPPNDNHYHSLTRFIQHCSQDLSNALDQPPPPPPSPLSFSLSRPELPMKKM